MGCGGEGVCKPFQTLPKKNYFPKVNFIFALEHRKPTSLLQRVWIFFPFWPTNYEKKGLYQMAYEIPASLNLPETNGVEKIQALK